MPGDNDEYVYSWVCRTPPMSTVNWDVNLRFDCCMSSNAIDHPLDQLDLAQRKCNSMSRLISNVVGRKGSSQC